MVDIYSVAGDGMINQKSRFTHQKNIILDYSTKGLMGKRETIVKTEEW